MLELQATDLPSASQAAQTMVDDADAVFSLMRRLMDQHEMLRERFVRLECEHQELSRSEENVRRENEERAEALGELRAAHQTLLAEYETRSQALQELGEQHGALLRERGQMAEELNAVIRHLRASREPVVLGTPAAE